MWHAVHHFVCTLYTDIYTYMINYGQCIVSALRFLVLKHDRTHTHRPILNGIFVYVYLSHHKTPIYLAYKKKNSTDISFTRHVAIHYYDTLQFQLHCGVYLIEKITFNLKKKNSQCKCAFRIPFLTYASLLKLHTTTTEMQLSNRLIQI